MKKFFAQLRPMERRLAVGVLVVLIVVLNWIFIWPHFSDWGDLRTRLNNARQMLAQRQTAIADIPKYQKLVGDLEKQGVYVPPEDQSVNFLRTIQMQAAASGFTPGNYGPQNTHTNQFYTELSKSIGAMATDSQLIDFLYKLGSGASMVRVRDLDLQPDVPHQHLNANMTLVASYQKKPAAPAAGEPPAPAASAPAPAAKPAAPAAAPAKPNSPTRTVPTKLSNPKTK